jgi:hypothetical protein
MTILKATKSALALSVALAVSGAAYANTNDADLVQDGVQNTAEITQDGDNLYADVAQTGDDNSAVVDQLVASMSDATITVTGNGNSSDVGQSGAEHQAEIVTTGDFNSAGIFQDGNSNTALVEQFGGDNDSVISQSGSLNDSYVISDGDNNAADIDIVGDDNLFDVYQYEYDNDVMGMVTGSFNDVYVLQTGYNNLVDITIEGDTNIVEVRELLGSRRNSDMTAFIDGDGNELYAAGRAGSGQSMSFDITGNDNYIDTFQFHNGVSLDFTTAGNSVSNNVADIDQAGAFSSISLLLTGSSNNIVMQQGGPSSNASNRIEGIGGTGGFHIGGDNGDIDLLQSGAQNVIQGMQMSDGSSINVSQTGNGNTAVITQI